MPKNINRLMVRIIDVHNNKKSKVQVSVYGLFGVFMIVSVI